MQTPNKERIQLLVDALRSGRYKQGRGTLHRKWTDENSGLPYDEYCCLGVACEVAAANGLDLHVRHDKEVCRFYYDEETAALPTRVAQWYGFGSSNPILAYQGRNTTAIGANDAQLLRFPEIADLFYNTYIEAADASAAA
jgi:hypothetical protein